MARDVGKTPQVVIRVSVEDKKLIKKLGGNYSDIFRLGFEKFLELAPEKMREKAEYHHKMWKKCNDIVTTRNEDLEILYQLYKETGRSTTNPTHHDISWIDARTRKITGVSTEMFLEYCKTKGFSK